MLIPFFFSISSKLNYRSFDYSRIYLTCHENSVIGTHFIQSHSFRTPGKRHLPQAQWELLLLLLKWHRDNPVDLCRRISSELHWMKEPKADSRLSLFELKRLISRRYIKGCIWRWRDSEGQIMNWLSCCEKLCSKTDVLIVLIRTWSQRLGTSDEKFYSRAPGPNSTPVRFAGGDYLSVCCSGKRLHGHM